MEPLTDVLNSLRKEQADLERQLARVNKAIDALTDMSDASVNQKVAKKVTTKKRKPMSAARKKAVSDSMKQYWADRKTGVRKK